MRGRMNTRDLITEKVDRGVSAGSVDVVDESHQHIGHAGHRPGGETHFRVYIVAEAFRGKSRLERHRMIKNKAVSGRRAAAPPPPPPPRAPGGGQA